MFDEALCNSILESIKDSDRLVYVRNDDSNRILIHIKITEEYLKEYPGSGSVGTVLESIVFVPRGTQTGSDINREGYTGLTYNQFKGLLISKSFPRLVEDGRLTVFSELPSGISYNFDMSRVVSENSKLKSVVDGLEKENNKLNDDICELEDKIKDLENQIIILNSGSDSSEDDGSDSVNEPSF